MEKSELEKILEQHELWLKSDGKESVCANFIGADLRNANLLNADLRKADLSNAKLSDANLISANLIDANLSGAVFVGANLSNAILTGANLSNADLCGANLRHSILSGSDLNDANLSNAELNGARGIVSFGPVGITGRIGYAVDHADKAMVHLGCFWGTQKTAIEAIQNKYGNNSNYEALVNAACAEVLND